MRYVFTVILIPLSIGGAARNSPRCNTMLHKDALVGSVCGVKQLLEWGDQKALAKALNTSESTALHNAAASGSLETVKVLIRVSPLNAQDNNRATALLVALTLGHENAAKALLEAKASPNVAGYKGITPLYVAATQDLEESVATLLKYGADPFAMTDDGREISSTNEKILLQLRTVRMKKGPK